MLITSGEIPRELVQVYWLVNDAGLEAWEKEHPELLESSGLRVIRSPPIK